MRYIAPILVALPLAAAVFAAPARAEKPAEPAKIRVLLTFGGHGFEEKPFFAMFDSMPGIACTKASMPKSAGLLKPGLEKQFGVIVMYDMSQWKPAEQKAFAALLNQGIGLVSLHHNMGAQRTWNEFPKIIGGKYCFDDCAIDGQKHGKSSYSHGEDMKVTVADKEHPITRGLADFTIHDETYKNYYTAPNVHVLLTTDHPKNDPKLAWTKEYGKSRVFYLMLGHDSKAWSAPSYKEIVARAIGWTAGR